MAVSNPHGQHPSPWSRTWALVRAEKQDVWAAAVYSVAVSLLSLALPIATQSLVNTVAFGTVLQPLVVLSVLVFAALSAAALLQCLRLMVIEMIQRRVFARLATVVADRLLRVRMDAFDRQSGPELVNRFLDVVTLQKSVALLLGDGLALTMQVIIGMLLLAAYHPFLLAFDLGLLLLIAVVLFGLGRGAVSTAIEESRAKYEVLAWLEEIALHRAAFRAQPAAAYARGRARTLVGAYLGGRASHFRILLRQFTGTLVLQAGATSVLLGIGGWLVMNGQLTLGQLIAAEIVVTMIVSSLVKFGKSLESLYDLQAAMDKIGYLTDLPVERSSGESASLPSGPATLRIHNVSYAYPHQENLFETPELEIGQGSRIALDGRGGTGKSTFLDILYALREPGTGTLELDGVDYRELPLSLLRDQIGLVRELEVFPGSVLDNVRLGTEADPLIIRKLLQDVGLLEEVTALPEGLATVLSTRGAPLSPSQAMRLMVARAILSKPRLLLLDEVLDEIKDLKIGGPLIRTLFDPQAPWTLLVATERDDLWPLCDQIFLLRDGRLAPHTVPAPPLEGDRT